MNAVGIMWLLWNRKLTHISTSQYPDLGDIIMILGIEVGGTFTDLVMADCNGNLTIHKLPSTPTDPSIAAVNGLQELLASSGVEAKEIVERQGGRASNSVSKNTDYVVAGPGSGTKLEKAKILGISIINEDEFEKLVNKG